jgi:hypothetical protein
VVGVHLLLESAARRIHSPSVPRGVHVRGERAARGRLRRDARPSARRNITVRAADR